MWYFDGQYNIDIWPLNTDIFVQMKIHILAKLGVKYDFKTSTAVDGAGELLFNRMYYKCDLKVYLEYFISKLDDVSFCCSEQVSMQ